MKSATVAPSAFSSLARSPLFFGACALALSACATTPSTSSSSAAPAPMAAAAPATPAAPMATPAPAAAPMMAAIDFTTKVQPFFATYCFRCHGPTRQSSRTRFDTKAGILARVTPGDPDGSRLVHMITDTGDDHMPPANIQDQPSADDIAMIKQWIKEGANIPDGYGS